jgi:hypothetical protein
LFLLGLLADLPRKNCWTIAEHAGDPDPHGMQHLLARASWDTDGVRDDLRDHVTGHLGDTDAVLVVDETGDERKGLDTVGVQRQYTGTAGRIENAQVAVYLAYAGERGHAFIDRELYLPRSWTNDDQRRRSALCGGRGARRHRVRHQASAGHRNDHPGAPRWCAGAVGGRRRDLRRGPWPACRAGTAPGRVRAGDRGSMLDEHQNVQPLEQHSSTIRTDGRGQISRPALQPESRQLPLRPRRTRRRLPADEA